MTATAKLMTRMLTFGSDQCFDGYPSTSNADAPLISEACAEEQDPIELIVFMSFLASEHATTREQYENCRRFLDAYLDNVWDTNMNESENPIYLENCECMGSEYAED